LFQSDEHNDDNYVPKNILVFSLGNRKRSVTCTRYTGTTIEKDYPPDAKSIEESYILGFNGTVYFSGKAKAQLQSQDQGEQVQAEGPQLKQTAGDSYSEAVAELNQLIGKEYQFISEVADHACAWRAIARQHSKYEDPEKYADLKQDYIAYCKEVGLEGMLPPHISEESRIQHFHEQIEDDVRVGTASRPLDPYLAWVNRQTSWAGELEFIALCRQLNVYICVMTLRDGGGDTKATGVHCHMYSPQGACPSFHTTPAYPDIGKWIYKNKVPGIPVIVLGHIAPNGKCERDHYSSGIDILKL
jgi:hypothetical protein